MERVNLYWLKLESTVQLCNKHPQANHVIMVGNCCVCILISNKSENNKVLWVNARGFCLRLYSKALSTIHPIYMNPFSYFQDGKCCKMITVYSDQTWSSMFYVTSICTPISITICNTTRYISSIEITIIMTGLQFGVEYITSLKLLISTFIGQLNVKYCKRIYN